jgi:2-iminobutanoate/2-iminopropanoate deaminase
MMANKRIETSRAPAAIGPYCQAVAVGEWVYCSGQVALDPDDARLAGNGDIEAETERVLQNLDAVLQEAGASREHVVKATVYLTNMDEFSKMNQVYAAFFDGLVPPARATVQVAALPRGAKVEIDFIARLEG